MNGKESEAGDAEDDERRDETHQLLPPCAWMIADGLHGVCQKQLLQRLSTLITLNKAKLKRQLESEGRRDERTCALDHARVAALGEEHGRARDDKEVLVLERSELRADAQVRADAV